MKGLDDEEFAPSRRDDVRNVHLISSVIPVLLLLYKPLHVIDSDLCKHGKDFYLFVNK